MIERFEVWLRSLTVRERWFAGGVCAFAAAFVGEIVACFTAWPSWTALDALGSIVGAMVGVAAVVLAIYGYFQGKRALEQNRTATQASVDATKLEHQAYIQIDLPDKAVLGTDGLKMPVRLINYGRTYAGDCQVSRSIWIKSPYTWENQWGHDLCLVDKVHPVRTESPAIREIPPSEYRGAIDIEPFLAGRATIAVEVRVWYLTVFGERRGERARRFYTGNNSDSASVFAKGPTEYSDYSPDE